MKKINLLFIAVTLILAISCKTAENMGTTYIEPEAPEPEITEEVEEEVAEELPEDVELKPVVERTERVEIADKTTTVTDTYNYYVIIGSFGIQENAQNYKLDMNSKGFNPIILKSSTGFYRVAVFQTNEILQARYRIAEIRSRYPEHEDTWLLINE